MKELIRKFRALEKKDQLIFFLVCSTVSNFANALTSIVLTQVVLLDTFANEYNSTLNGYTGMGVSLAIIALGLYMIISMKKNINYS